MIIIHLNSLARFDEHDIIGLIIDDKVRLIDDSGKVYNYELTKSRDRFQLVYHDTLSRRVDIHYSTIEDLDIRYEVIDHEKDNWQRVNLFQQPLRNEYYRKDIVTYGDGNVIEHFSLYALSPEDMNQERGIIHYLQAWLHPINDNLHQIPFKQTEMIEENCLHRCALQPNIHLRIYDENNREVEGMKVGVISDSMFANMMEDLFLQTLSDYNDDGFHIVINTPEINPTAT